MVATDVNSLPSATFCATSAKSLAQPPKAIARAVAPSSRAPLLETGTWRTRNASHEERQIQTGKRQS